MNVLGRRGTIGRSAPVAAAPDEVRQARIDYARGNSHWTEIPETRLVRRGPGWLIDADSDLVWVLRRGVAFERDGGRPSFIHPSAPATFYVDRHGDVRFLEQLTTPASWSEHVERQARRNARTRKPL